MLAATVASAVRVYVSGNTYRVTSDCSGIGVPAALTEPATNAAFLITVPTPLTLAGPATLDFDSLVRPGACSANPCAACVASASVASYSIGGGAATYAIAVQPVSGFAGVTP